MGELSVVPGVACGERVPPPAVPLCLSLGREETLPSVADGWTWWGVKSGELEVQVALVEILRRIEVEAADVCVLIWG